jgi:hypothetical protein
MKILCTFPGRHGDLLWALPTIRAIQEHFKGEVALQIGQEYAGLVPLLQAQPYLAEVWAQPGWQGDRGDLRVGWEAPPPPVLQAYDAVYHLGYRRWPTLPLPDEIWIEAVSTVGEPLPPIDLRRPWITVPPLTVWATPITVGFTDEWFELKVGITVLLQRGPWGADWYGYLLTGDGSRWHHEAGHAPTDWIGAARRIAACRLFLGDCSALHVLAVALGTPAILVEPNEARWNGIFWPLGQDGPETCLVKGHDHRPTFDVRHVRAAITTVREAWPAGDPDPTKPQEG